MKKMLAGFAGVVLSVVMMACGPQMTDEEVAAAEADVAAQDGVEVTSEAVTAPGHCYLDVTNHTNGQCVFESGGVCSIKFTTNSRNISCRLGLSQTPGPLACGTIKVSTTTCN